MEICVSSGLSDFTGCVYGSLCGCKAGPDTLPDDCKWSRAWRHDGGGGNRDSGREDPFLPGGERADHIFSGRHVSGGCA